MTDIDHTSPQITPPPDPSSGLPSATPAKDISRILPDRLCCQRSLMGGAYRAYKVDDSFLPSNHILYSTFTMSRMESWSNYRYPNLFTIIYNNADQSTSYHTYSYVCSLCQLAFQVPDWVHQPSDLDRALRHHCHGGVQPEDYVQKCLRESADYTTETILRKIHLSPPLSKAITASTLSWLASLIQTHILCNNQELWQGLKQLARENREGR